MTVALVIITVIITAIGVRNIDRTYENICILEAYLMGVDDTISGTIEYEPKETIKRVKQTVNEEIKR